MKSERNEGSLRALLGLGDNNTSHTEKLISGLGAMLSIVLVYYISHWYLESHSGALMVASMGATAVLLFAVPHGALSQPWAVLVGHLVSGAIGVSCQILLPDNPMTPALAVGLAVAAMHYLRCIHPPGGATALTAVVGGESVHALGYAYLFTPVLLNLICMLSVAVLFNALFHWRRYPAVLARRPANAGVPVMDRQSSMLTHEDLAAAMEKLDSYVDVTSEELAQLFDLAVEHAAQSRQESISLKVGRYYSNGLYGEKWAIRQILDGPENMAIERERLVFKTVAGDGSYGTGSCTLREFREWVGFPVEFTGERWVRLVIQTPD
ncbi:HPP family protein [Marinobacterium mangrovicola]|uniref:HPP family protein n=1 Tax=Marinobacterium mangrovicola TaxID=1476959 RepID=A0A4R1GK61_9GAMM|nr:HPP family protein [Marinobacterium mangrovicola]TCK08787.1 HPP family protein [Marinobacterium mangrovicola]